MPWLRTGERTSFEQLIEETEWDKYGTGVNPKCADCMVHSGYEATAVNDTFRRPWKALKVFLNGPETDAPMAPEVPFQYEDEPVRKQLELVVERKPSAGCSAKEVA